MADMASAKKELQVNVATAQLDKMIEDVRAQVSRLCERTNPVRRQEPAAAMAKAEGSSVSSVPLVAQLNDFHGRLNGIRNQVNDTLDQLEI